MGNPRLDIKVFFELTKFFVQACKVLVLDSSGIALVVAFFIIFTLMSQFLKLLVNLLKHDTPLLKILFSSTTSGSNSALMLFVFNLYKVFFQHLLMLLVLYEIWGSVAL